MFKTVLVSWGVIWFSFATIVAEEPALTTAWTQLGGNPQRNSVAVAPKLPDTWNNETGENIKWRARIGSSSSCSCPTVLGTKIFVGSDNAGLLPEYPVRTPAGGVDMGTMLCFEAATGKFLWQYSSLGLPARRPECIQQSICSTPAVEGERLYFLSNRCELVCLDTEGFYDSEDDGIATQRLNPKQNVEADVVWKLDLIQELGVSPQHRSFNFSSVSSPAISGNVLFLCTGNGVEITDNDTGLPQSRVAAPHASCFIAVDKHTGKLLWQDNSPGANLLNGQCSSPAVGKLGGVMQVLFSGSDGWLYSFRADKWKDGKPLLLWKFDCNPKASEWNFGGSSEKLSRIPLTAPPVIADGLVYLGMGDDPREGWTDGRLWCIDPTKRGDVSPTLVVDKQGKQVPHRRLQALDISLGEKEIPNPNSAALWKYEGFDLNSDGKLQLSEKMHGTSTPPVIKNHLLLISDSRGMVHCLDAKTGKSYWNADLWTNCWNAPLVIDQDVYLGDYDRNVSIFQLSKNGEGSIKWKTSPDGEKIPEPKRQIEMGGFINAPLVVVNNVLFISIDDHLIAIEAGAKSQPLKED